MSQRSWPTMTAGGLCHLVVVDAASPDTLKDLLALAVTAGDYAVEEAEGQTLVAFTSFADTERFTAALRDVRSVRQIDPRWASEWNGVYDAAAGHRAKQELRWSRRRVVAA